MGTARLRIPPYELDGSCLQRRSISRTRDHLGPWESAGAIGRVSICRSSDRGGTADDHRGPAGDFWIYLCPDQLVASSPRRTLGLDPWLRRLWDGPAF